MKINKILLPLFLLISCFSWADSGTFYPSSSAGGGGGGGTPGGANTQIQFNNAGVFGGDSGFLTNGAGILDLDGELQLTDDSPIRFGNSAVFGLAFDTSGVRKTLTLTNGTQTGLAVSAQVPSILFDLSANKTFVAGNGTIQGDISILSPTYNGTAPGTSFFGVCMFCLEGAPNLGSNLDDGAATFGMIIGNPAGKQYGWDQNSGLGVIMTGISDGVGNISQRTGIIVTGNPTGQPIDLGNQTAQLGSATGIKVEATQYSSDTNVRTIENASGIDVSAPIAGSNVTIINGPYAINARDDSSFKRLVFEGDSDISSSNLNWDSNIISIANGGTINTITPPIDNKPTILILTFVDSVTLDNENGGTGEMRFAGNIDAVMTADDTLTLVWNTASSKWLELSRSVN